VEQQEGITWAPAFYIQGDKVSFYRCGFIGIQDTLTDWQGRHYFESCYIEGAIDFIWGGGQSIYQVNLIQLAYIYHISFTNNYQKKIFLSLILMGNLSYGCIFQNYMMKLKLFFGIFHF
jgi:hypothetical protein